jgi:UDP-glucose 4-epimerase
VPYVELGRFQMSEILPDISMAALSSVDTIVWAASGVNPKMANDSPQQVANELLLWKHFISKVALLESTLGKNLQIIFLSSGGCVYDGTSPPFEVGDPARGINYYGKMKVQMEQMLVDSLSFWSILRVSNAYGLGQPSGRGQGVFAEWNHSLIEKRPLRVFGSINQVRDYINIVDVSKGIFLTSQFKTRGIFNLGYGTGYSIEQAQELYGRFWKFPLAFEYHPKRGIDRNSYWLEMRNTQSAFNWRPQIDLEQGIREMLERLKSPL